MNRIHPDPTTPGGLQQMSMAVRLAGWAVIADVEECPAVTLDGLRHYDTRPMLDPREHSPEVIDMATLALQYGLSTGLLARHPQQAHMVRVTAVGLMS